MEKHYIYPLIDLITVRAKIDETEPGSDNLQNGWRTDELLQDIDELIIGNYNDPSKYAEIGRQVLVLAKAGKLPELAALARLAILRGERLLPVNPEREKTIIRIIEETKNTIAALPNNTRKMRCESLFHYHVGVFYTSYGRFDLAANEQKEAAEKAGLFGDRTGMTFSYFMETLYRLKDALYKGRETETIFSKLEERFTQLIYAAHGSLLEVQITEHNGPAHMIQACVWLNRTHPNWNEWITTVIAAENKLGKQWKSSIGFVRAVDMDSRGDSGANNALRAIIESNDKGNDVNERKAAALLILARHAIQDGKIKEATKIINQIPEQGAQHVRAIAEHMLKKSKKNL